MRVFLAFAFIVSLSGCVSDSAASDPADDGAQLSLDIACIGAFSVRTPPFAAVEPWLEQGFEAEDAAVFLQSLGLPIPAVDRGLMAMFAEQCGVMDVRLQFLILVEPPNIGVNFDANAFHWYEVKTFVTEAGYVQDLTNLGFPHELMHANTTAAGLPPPVDGAYSTYEFISTAEGDSLVELRTSASGDTLSLDNSFVSWHVNPNGTQVLEMDFQMTAKLGIGTCLAKPIWIQEFMPICHRISEIPEPAPNPDLLPYSETLSGTITELFAKGDYNFYPGMYPS